MHETYWAKECSIFRCPCGLASTSFLSRMQAYKPVYFDYLASILPRSGPYFTEIELLGKFSFGTSVSSSGLSVLMAVPPHRFGTKHTAFDCRAFPSQTL